MGGDTGNSVWSSIGRAFETTLKSRLDGIEDTEGERLPDLRGDGFWLEAKCGYKGNGPHVHDFQWWYDDLEDPVYYVFGYHNLDNVSGRMGHLTTDRGRENYLSRHMQVEEVHILPLDIVQRIFDKDKGKGPKGREFDLVMNRSIPRNIILRREFRRGGEIVQADIYYGFNSEEHIMEILNPEENYPFPCSYAVRKSDISFIDFLQKNNLYRE